MQIPEDHMIRHKWHRYMAITSNDKVLHKKGQVDRTPCNRCEQSEESNWLLNSYWIGIIVKVPNLTQEQPQTCHSMICYDFWWVSLFFSVCSDHLVCGQPGFILNQHNVLLHKNMYIMSLGNCPMSFIEKISVLCHTQKFSPTIGCTSHVITLADYKFYSLIFLASKVESVAYPIQVFTLQVIFSSFFFFFCTIIFEKHCIWYLTWMIVWWSVMCIVSIVAEQQTKSSVQRQNGLTIYCFKYADRSFCLQTDEMDSAYCCQNLQVQPRDLKKSTSNITGVTAFSTSHWYPLSSWCADPLPIDKIHLETFVWWSVLSDGSLFKR